LLWDYWSHITALPLALTGVVNAGCAPALPQERKGARHDRTASFQTTVASEDRLAAFAKTARELAAQLPPGAEKVELLRKAEHADATAGLSNSFEETAQQPLKASR
jgi:hypothetical protein